MAVVDALLADPRIGWLPVRHHSPAAAYHVGAWIRANRPAAVLVEAPEDATGQIPWLVHAEAAPPLALLFAFKGDDGQRVRYLWPLLGHDPEWVAIRAAAEIGAELRMIDAPVRALQAVGGLGVDRGGAAEEAYLQAVAARSRRPTFDAFWESRFEAGADQVPTDRFRRAVLTLAACARAVDDAPGPATALREGHLRWAVDQALAAHPGERIAVVVGAMHAVVLPATPPKRARARADATATVLLTAPSNRALARRGVTSPAWGEAQWDALNGGPDPAERVLVEVTGAARRAGAPVGTADTIGAVRVAVGLAALRGGGVTRDDVADGARSALTKGSVASAGGAVARALDEVLTGTRRGVVPPEAGRPPLVEDFWASIAAHRLTLGDRVQEVRCSIADKPKHQEKSAFLHRCAALGVPMFGPLPDLRGDDAHFRGPNYAEGADLHLTIERWGVRGDLEIDDTLLEVAERGTTIAEAAGDLLVADRGAAGPDAAARARLVLRAAQMRLTDVLPALLDELEAAIALDGAFLALVEALGDLHLLWSYRRALPTHGDARVARVRGAAYDRACLALPAVRGVAETEVERAVDALHAITRFAATEPTADRDRLAERLGDVAQDDRAQPRVRGAATGLLAGLGLVPIEAAAEVLSQYLRGSVHEVRRGGAFLEGVLGATRSASIGSPRLISAVHDVLVRLPEEEFVAVLPDLRRAFAVFVPAEVERIGEQVAALLAGPGADDEDAPIPAAAAERMRALDEQIARRLAAAGR